MNQPNTFIELQTVSLSVLLLNAQGVRSATEVRILETEPGVFELTVELVPGTVSLEVKARVPLRDLHQVFVTPLIEGLGQKTWVNLPWILEEAVASHHGLPVIIGRSRHGRNRFLLGAREQDAEAKISFQLEYPDAQRPAMGDGIFSYQRRFSEPPPPRLAFLISLRDHAWGQALSDYAGWVASSLPPIKTLEAALEPVWCSWYLRLEKTTAADISEQLPRLKELGFGTVIIDGSWCHSDGKSIIPQVVGCWEVDAGKFPSLKDLVGEIQSYGLKAMLWVAPFWIGAECPVRERFRHLLGKVEGIEQNSLDPRLPETRAYVRELAARLMRDFGLDGLKVDFVDAAPHFAINSPWLDTIPGLDYETESVSVAMLNCLAALQEGIRSIKRDALVEFRQNYANLATRPYATSFRAQDSPFDPDRIRTLVCQLKMTCPQSVIHADPAIWHASETPENIAIFMASMCLYSTPMFSSDFLNMRADHLDLVRWWLDFSRHHIADIQAGRIRLISHDEHFTSVINVGIAAGYAGFFGVFPPRPEEFPVETLEKPLFIFNGTTVAQVLIPIPAGQTHRVQIADCHGRTVGQLDTREGRCLLPVPVGGHAWITPQKPDRNCSVWECDMLEAYGEPVGAPNGCFQHTLNPFEIRSFIIQSDGEL